MGRFDLFEPEIDFGLVCVACHQREHRIAWAMNQSMGISLHRMPADLDILGPDGVPTAMFPLYGHEDLMSARQIMLIGNRSLPGSGTMNPEAGLFSTEQSMLLLPELPSVDYFMVCQGQWSASDLDNLAELVKCMSMVITAYAQDPKLLKNANNLIC